MIKRDRRNIGKTVKIIGHKDFNNRTGIVKGFRGDFGHNDPVVNVYVISIHSIWPFPGSHLKEIRKQIERNINGKYRL